MLLQGFELCWGDLGELEVGHDGLLTWQILRGGYISFSWLCAGGEDGDF